MSNFVGKNFQVLVLKPWMKDTFQVNVLEEAVKKQKKVILFWYPKDFTLCMPNWAYAFQEALPEFEKEIH